MFDHIMVCVDGSEAAIKAAGVAARLAKTFGSKLTVVHLCHAPIISEPFHEAQDIDVMLINRYAEQTFREVVERTLPAVRRARVAFEFLEEVGSPTETIVRVARLHGVDHIVIGSRGLDSSEAVQIGSVSYGVIHRAHCPVTVVK